jgi:ketosteroid isomerase-like protein
MTAERLDRFAAAWLRGDRNELRAYLTEDVAYSPLSRRPVQGREAVVRRFGQLFAAGSNCELRFEPATVSGSLGTCRWRMSGHTAEGAAFEIEGIDIYEFDGDRIRSKDAYQKG